MKDIGPRTKDSRYVTLDLLKRDVMLSDMRVVLGPNMLEPEPPVCAEVFPVSQMHCGSGKNNTTRSQMDLGNSRKNLRPT